MKVKFKDKKYLEIEIPDEVNLYEYLHVNNSPVLFGCRTGLCGICLKKVKILNNESSLSEPSDIEKEALEIYADGVSGCRLLCQLKAKGEILVE